MMFKGSDMLYVLISDVNQSLNVKGTHFRSTFTHKLCMYSSIESICSKSNLVSSQDSPTILSIKATVGSGGETSKSEPDF